jgi:hypothetical protein
VGPPSSTPKLLPATDRGVQSFPILAILAARERSGAASSRSVCEGEWGDGATRVGVVGNGWKRGLGRRITRALAEAGSNVAVVIDAGRFFH